MANEEEFQSKFRITAPESAPHAQHTIITVLDTSETWHYAEDIIFSMQPAHQRKDHHRAGLRQVVYRNHYVRAFAALPRRRDLDLKGNLRVLDDNLRVLKIERISAMLMYLTGDVPAAPCEPSCGGKSGTFAACVVASAQTREKYRGCCANHLYHRQGALCRFASNYRPRRPRRGGGWSGRDENENEEQSLRYATSQFTGAHSQQAGLALQTKRPYGGTDDSDSLGEDDDDDVSAAMDASASVPPSQEQHQHQQYGESDFYLKCADPAQARELFHLLKTAVVEKLRSPYTLEIRVAGDTPEEEFHFRREDGGTG